jgi:hypothetical protein
VTVIWQHDSSGWQLLTPSGFPAESALHELVEQAPQILPLAGEPQLVVLGSEVLLGGNYADLIAVEPSGRLAVIEIKLAKNAEARRAVVAQILTYAAYLRGLSPERLEREILGPHMLKRDYESLAAAARSNDQASAFDTDSFAVGLAESLRTGRFRLVLVLDEAPSELVRLVGYLEAVTDNLLIDLITVASYQIGGSNVIIPTRIDPEQEPKQPMAQPAPVTPAKGYGIEGADDFEAAIDEAPESDRETLWQMLAWARELESTGLAKLWTYHGASGRLTLLPYIPGESAGLVTLWNDSGAYISFWRSVFLRRAPDNLPHIEDLVKPTKIGQGNTTRLITDELLDALTRAYCEAAQGRVMIDQ